MKLKEILEKENKRLKKFFNNGKPEGNNSYNLCGLVYEEIEKFNKNTEIYLRNSKRNNYYIGDFDNKIIKFKLERKRENNIKGSYYSYLYPYKFILDNDEKYLEYEIKDLVKFVEEKINKINKEEKAEEKINFQNFKKELKKRHLTYKQFKDLEYLEDEVEYDDLENLN